MNVRSLHDVSLCVLLVLVAAAATCWGTPPPNNKALEQQRACVELLTQRALDVAQPHCELCLEFDPFNPECHNALGLMAYLRGDDDTARKRYLEALRLNPEFAEARNNLGALEMSRGDLERAAMRFRSALAIAPDYVDARYNLALTQLKLGQREHARSAGDGAGARQREMDFYASSEAEYLRLLALRPHHVEAQHDLCALHGSRAALSTTVQKQNEELVAAEACCALCLQLSPTHTRCLAGLAHLYRATGRCAEATAAAQRCVELDPGDESCRSLLLESLACAGAQHAVPQHVPAQ
ncbi:MAG: tetratricopeptide repeat protein [Pseudomonadota bacterium]